MNNRIGRWLCVGCIAPLALSVITTSADAAGWRGKHRLRVGHGRLAGWKLRQAVPGARFAVRNSQIKGKGNPAYYDYSRDTQVKAEVKRMEGVLNGRATPGYNIFLFPKPGVRITPGQDSLKICSGGKACTVDAIAVMPTSGHVPGRTAQQLAKDQRHTIWTVAGNKGYRDKSNVLIDGAPSKGNLVTVVKFNLQLKPGANYVYFDPYPGRTAGVVGFADGRTHKLVVE